MKIVLGQIDLPLVVTRLVVAMKMLAVKGDRETNTATTCLARMN